MLLLGGTAGALARCTARGQGQTFSLLIRVFRERVRPSVKSQNTKQIHQLSRCVIVALADPGLYMCRTYPRHIGT